MARGSQGGQRDGGGRAVAPQLPPFGGASCGFLPWPPFRRRRIPPRRTRSFGVVGQPLAPAAVRCRRASLAGGEGGRPMSCPPVGLAGGPGGQGVATSQPVRLPPLGGLLCGRHRRRSGLGGRGPHTAPARCHVLPPGVVRALPLCAGVGSPACRDSLGSTRRGLRGSAACDPAVPPPPGVAVPPGGGGTPPLPRGGV